MQNLKLVTVGAIGILLGSTSAGLFYTFKGYLPLLKLLAKTQENETLLFYQNNQLYIANQSMASALSSKGYDISYASIDGNDQEKKPADGEKAKGKHNHGYI